MEKTTKHLLFKSSNNGDIYVFNKKSLDYPLGIIYYYKSWKKYVFDIEEGMMFDSTCLKDIYEVLEELDKEKSNGK